MPITKRAIITALLLCILSVLTGCDPSSKPSPNEKHANISQLIKRNCGWQLSAGYHSPSYSPLSVKCYWYTHSQNSRFKLPLTVFSKTQFKSDGVLAYIPGGPGHGLQVAASNLEYWSQWYDDNPMTADLLIYNPRGVLGSKPFWYCEEYDKQSLILLAKNVSYREESEQGLNILERCIKDFNQWLEYLNLPEASNISNFSTNHQAADLLNILDQLNYQQWHLWGVSYGSRVALKAAKQAEQNPVASQRLQSQILDSPYPFNQGRQSAWGKLQANALNIHSQYWDKQYPQRAGEFKALWATANRAIVLVEENELKYNTTTANSTLLFSIDNLYFSDFPEKGVELLPIYTQDTFKLYLNRHRLQSIMSFVLYDSNLQPIFFEALQELVKLPESANTPASKNSATTHIQMLVDYFIHASFDPAFNSLVFYATECTDNPREDRALIKQAAEQYPQWQRMMTTMGEYDICRLDLFASSSANINRVSQGDDYNLNLPTLILSGNKDHVTPLAWAQELYTLYPKANKKAWLVEADSSHSVISSGGCSSDGIASWLDSKARINILTGTRSFKTDFCTQ